MYTIKNLSILCGLTERTLRNYLKMGILTGNKENGVWQFNTEQIDHFLSHDYTKAAMTSNRNAVLFDYLHSFPEKNSACIILDLPQENSTNVATFFCEAVNKRSGLQMTFDKRKGSNRVVLIGEIKNVSDVLNEYHSINDIHSF